MRKVLGLAVGAAMMAAGPAGAEQWWYVTESVSGTVIFVDADSLESNGNLRQFWRQFIYKKPEDNVKVSMALTVIDCARRTSKMLSYVAYNTDREVVSSNSYNYPSESPIPPGTIIDALRRLVCSPRSEWASGMGTFPIFYPPLEVADIIHSQTDAEK